jgi:hypothetical protein
MIPAPCIMPHELIVRPGFLCLIDRSMMDGNEAWRSITNDAEKIILYMIALGHDLARNRVIYRDTTGNWDELIVVNSEFAGFRFIGESDLDAAIAKASSPA